jgi:CheY-like chemotaxis protein
MNLTVQADFTQLTRKLNRAQREQVPFAIAQTLNALADDTANAITVQMDRYLDRPTPFTKKAYLGGRGFKGKRATKRSFEAILIPGDIQAKYLKFQIEGGIRRPDQKAILVPTKLAPKNKYGNLTRANRKRMVAGGGKFFSAGDREGKTPGIYKRVGNTVQPFAFYVDEAKYEAIFPIDKIANGIVSNRLQKRFSEALARALATAR